MIKSKLISFIGRYNLGGLIESVKFVVKDKILTTSIISEEKNAFGIIQMKDFNLEDIDIGIGDTSKLKSLLNILSEDITMEVEKTGGSPTSLKIHDKETSINFALSELDVIPNVPNLKKVPVFNLEIPLTKEFISKFIKSKSALNEDHFTIIQSTDAKSKELVTKVVIGYSGKINNNNVSITVVPTVGKDKISNKISFSAKYLKEILSVNQDQYDAILNISDSGLAFVQFGTDKTEFLTKYYLIKVDIA